ncbi:MAG TPA: sulfatase [Solirubrobacterales bacterium]|nr:sulfatase [Solirubrobacterales bacterium]
MRATRKIRVAVALGGIAAAVALTSATGEPAAAGGQGRPNIVLITTDDQTAASLRVMGRTRQLLADQGADFKRFYATFPLCCPSRATYLTGQYAHNHGVIDNLARFGGGYPAMREPDKVLPVFLKQAGYETALIGKFLHDYRSLERPPGWDVFLSLLDGSFTRYYGYEMTDSLGGSMTFGDSEADYVTDALTNRFAVPYIRSRAGNPAPFFLHLSYTAPHWGTGRNDEAGRRCVSPEPFAFDTARAKPAPRHAQAFANARLPQPPSFNEKEIGDKPALISREPRFSAADRRALARRYRCELASLLAVDEGIAAVNQALTDAGLAGNTVVMFTSDNGYMHGQHRLLGGKVQPYEEAVRVPFLMRGPGVPAGEVVKAPAGNVDIVPTILDFAGVGPGRTVDGVSLRAGTARDRAVLLEAKRPAKQTARGDVAARSWSGVRTRRYTYIEHFRAAAPAPEQGFALPIGAGKRTARELYDNRLDPYQLSNEARSARYAAARRQLARLARRLRGCAGEACFRQAEVPPPTKRR